MTVTARFKLNSLVDGGGDSVHRSRFNYFGSMIGWNKVVQLINDASKLGFHGGSCILF